MNIGVLKLRIILNSHPQTVTKFKVFQRDDESWAEIVLQESDHEQRLEIKMTDLISFNVSLAGAFFEGNIAELEEIEFSNVSISLNGYPQQITGIKVVEQEDDNSWVQVGLQGTSGYNQCLEIRVSDLAKASNQLAGFRQYVEDAYEGASEVAGETLSDVVEVGEVFFGALKAAGNAFLNEFQQSLDPDSIGKKTKE